MKAKKKDYLFDRKRMPNKTRWFMKPVIFFAFFPELLLRRFHLDKTRMKGIKPPYLLLMTHNAFVDFRVMAASFFPKNANYVVGMDGFYKREKLLQNCGAFGKRRFTNDVNFVFQLREIFKNHREIVVMYPETRFSLCGTPTIIPDSLGKLISLSPYPVIMLKTYGHHISQPFWDIKSFRFNRIEAEMYPLFTSEELEEIRSSSSSREEKFAYLNERLREAFQYDDFAWQRDNHIKVKYRNRARGLHHVLYQCPHCQHEFSMASAKDRLWCEHCGKSYRMDYYGVLSCENGDTIFSHIPDWYEWERANVREQIETNTYRYEGRVRVESLPNPSHFFPLSDADLVHDSDGFHLRAIDGSYVYHKKVPDLYSLHIEYVNHGRGECFELADPDLSYYIYPPSPMSVTKFSLAVEELHQKWKKEH